MLVKLTLEPVWECNFEHNSYGFRPTRGQEDAIAKIFSHIRRHNRLWVFEGDFKSCFDTLDHNYIMVQVKYFPASKVIKRWLEAGLCIWIINLMKQKEWYSTRWNNIPLLLANITVAWNGRSIKH